MSAGKHDIYIEQGATWQMLVTWQTPDQTPIDVTGFKGRMHIRLNANSCTIEADLTTENGKIVLGGTAGTVQLVLTAAQTSELTLVNGVYDLELESPTGVVTRLLQGNVTVDREITRA